MIRTPPGSTRPDTLLPYPLLFRSLGSLRPVDDAWLALARDSFPAFGPLPGPRTTMLVGGPTSAVRFDPDSLDRWFDMVAAAVAREGGSLLLSASRRTQEAIRARLREPCM